MRKLAHIVNPFKVSESSDLHTAQPISFESMRRAKEYAKKNIDVELVSAQFNEDRALVPEGFKATSDLENSVLDLHNFNKQVKLPLLTDILKRLYEESDAEYLIYTNVDIGLYPNFYLKVNEFIEQGYDAFIINRRRIEAKYTSVLDLEKIYEESGHKHPGFDCFVFHRSLYPKLKLQGICIGVPFIEISFSQNLFALANHFKLFEEEKLTFHIGMEIYKKRVPSEYFWYNRKQFHAIEKELWPLMNLEKFPYSDKYWIVRFFKWMLHPCIPTRLVIKLEMREALENFVSVDKMH
jgi:hypothetical protein